MLSGVDSVRSAPGARRFRRIADLLEAFERQRGQHANRDGAFNIDVGTKGARDKDLFNIVFGEPFGSTGPGSPAEWQLSPTVIRGRPFAKA